MGKSDIFYDFFSIFDLIAVITFILCIVVQILFGKFYDSDIVWMIIGIIGISFGLALEFIFVWRPWSRESQIRVIFHG